VPTQVEDVLWTKLHVPSPPSTYVARPRLAARVEAGLRRDGLVLLCAPAGFGKSALLAACCQRSNSATAWLSLDQADNDPIRFWRHVAASLDHAIGDESTIVQSLDRAGVWERGAADEAIVTALINANAGVAGDVALALDDYHLVENEAVHRGLRYLIQHLPPTLRVVVATRADPPLELPRLRARGRLTEIRAADLRFNAAESGQLLSALAHTDVAEEVSAVLTDRTEGWAAGLQLAGLSLEGGAEAETLAASFTGEHRFVLDYLTEEVLDRQPPERREFLLQTSILDRLCGPVCDAVTGGKAGQATLEAIDAANLFVVPLDDTRRWWRYHHLFADLLRVRLQQRGDEEIADLHRRAAEWHRANDNIDRAIHHAWAAGDGAWAARLIEDNADTLLLRSEGATLLRWLDQLPVGLVNTDRLTVARARIAVYGGRLREAEELLDSADPAQGGPTQPTPAGEQDSTGPLDDLVLTVDLLRAYIAHMRGDAKTAIDIAARAANEAGEGSIIGLIARWHLAAGPWLRGDVIEAVPALASNAAGWRNVEQYDRAALSANRLGRVHRACGNLDAALETYEAILDRDAAHTGPDTPVAGVAHVGIAEVAYERNDLETARVHARLGISMCGDFIYTQALAGGWSILARIHQAEGNPDAAGEAMGNALQLTAASDVVDLLNPVPAQLAQLSISQGDLTAAERWSRTQALPPDGPPTHQREPAELTWARLMLARGEPDNALERVDQLRSLAAGQGRHGSVIEIEILRALALAGMGETAAALDALQVATDLAAPSGYVRIFADEGEPMAELLQLLGERPGDLGPVAEASINGLIEACRSRPETTAGPESANDDLVVPLTERELEVLAQLIDGKPNKEICAELFISLNTVKKHITHIFDKLGVRNRTEATARARQLDLLNNAR
jgi:LuxR family maltose regulon positive regulatory protein